jgi:hypothetical protein
MNTEIELKLPFELPKNYKCNKKNLWKKQGILFTPEGFDYWYEKYIYATNCEICDKEFNKRQDRYLYHNNGIVRNIVCNKCKKIDLT